MKFVVTFEHVFFAVPSRKPERPGGKSNFNLF